MKICPKCNYERIPSDQGLPTNLCPDCGVVYEKFDQVRSKLSNGDAEKIRKLKSSYAEDVHVEQKKQVVGKRKGLVLKIVKKSLIVIALFYALVFAIAQFGFLNSLLPIACFFMFKRIFIADSEKSSSIRRIIQAISFFGVVLILIAWINIEHAPRKIENKPIVELTHQQKIRKGFSGWNGSHRDFVMATKKVMNDPDSFEHVETVYKDNDDGTLRLMMTFRGKNMFGAKILSETIAVSDIETGKVIMVLQ